MPEKRRRKTPTNLSDFMSTEAKSLPSQGTTSNPNRQESVEEGSEYKNHASSFVYKFETVPLRAVALNYKNKRVVTQLIRFIPDDVTEEALKSGDTQSYILNNINKIPVNNIILEFEKAEGKEGKNRKISSSRQSDIINYPNHKDLYDVRAEGIFIGKGVCFTNINSSSEQLSDLINNFVEQVKTHGASLSSGDGLAEHPAIIKQGSQSILLYGHQRYCYLVYQYGLNHLGYFIYKKIPKKQDKTIYAENNLKTAESGFEQLLSYYFTAKESNKKSVEDLCAELSISRAYYFKIKPFINDIRLIEAIKTYALSISKTDAIKCYEDAKKAVELVQAASDDTAVYRTYVEILKVKYGEVSIEKEKRAVKPSPSVKPQTNVAFRVPVSKNQFEKLFFEDVRKWSNLDPNDFNLDAKSGIKKYLNALLAQLNDSE